MSTVRDNLMAPYLTDNRLSLGEDQQVYITTQGGEARLVELKPSAGSFSRTLDSVSSAQLVLPTNDECCEALANVGLGKFELEWWRDGILAWAGPIWNVQYTRGFTTIQASDYTSWWSKRILPTVIDRGVDSAQAVQNLHEAAMESDPVRGMITTIVPTGQIINSEVFAADYALAYDVISELASIDVDFTAYGRNILIGPQELVSAPTIALNDADWLGAVNISQRGDEFATRIIARDSNGNAARADADPLIQLAYGLVERVIDFEYIIDLNLLQRAADSAIDLYSNPYFLVTPSDSGLRAGASAPFSQLIPGTIVRASTEQTCLNLTLNFRLESVTNNINGSVGIRLEPLGSEGGG